MVFYINSKWFSEEKRCYFEKWLFWTEWGKSRLGQCGSPKKSRTWKQLVWVLTIRRFLRANWHWTLLLPQTKQGRQAESDCYWSLRGSDTAPNGRKRLPEISFLQMSKLLKKKTSLIAVTSTLTQISVREMCIYNTFFFKQLEIIYNKCKQ